jgi:hypothetical protein
MPSGTIEVPMTGLGSPDASLDFARDQASAIACEAVQVPLARFDATPDEQSLFARARARAAFGTVLIIGSALLLVMSIVGDGAADPVFVGVWPTALGAYVCVRAAASKARRRVDPMRDLWFARSWVLVGVGLALFGPLSIHMGIALVMQVEDLRAWVVLSFGTTGAAHIALAWMLARRAEQLARGATPRSLGSVYWITVAWSCVPGMIFLAVPSFFVALTGLPMLLVIASFDQAIRDERGEREVTSGMPAAVPA